MYFALLDDRNGKKLVEKLTVQLQEDSNIDIPNRG